MLLVHEEIASSSTWSLQWTCTLLGLLYARQKRNDSICEDVHNRHTNYTRIGLQVGFHQVNDHFKMSINFCDIISVLLFHFVFMSSILCCVWPSLYHQLELPSHIQRCSFGRSVEWTSTDLCCDIWHTAKIRTQTSENFTVVLKGSSAVEFTLCLI
jgi:hypothetical protein